jgi:hypothetical protein
VNSLTFLAPLILAITACEIFLPGRDLYHLGWFNLLLAALVVACLIASRGAFRSVRGTRARVAVAAIAFGAAIAGFAGVASGLLAPDNKTIVGAPGSNVRVDDLGGTLAFPLKTAAGDATPDVAFVRSGWTTPIGPGSRDIGSFVLRQVPRDVVYVEASDARGASLTVTQPNGSTFLSPVLLLEQKQKIPGTNLNLPFDAFAVPAAHRNVKAVLFSPEQAAMLHPAGGLQGQAVLFAIDDEADKPLPNSIALAHDGETVEVGGLRLKASLFRYPAIEYMAAPSLVAVVLGALAVAAGFIFKNERAAA